MRVDHLLDQEREPIRARQDIGHERSRRVHVQERSQKFADRVIGRGERWMTSATPSLCNERTSSSARASSFARKAPMTAVPATPALAR